MINTLYKYKLFIPIISGVIVFISLCVLKSSFMPSFLFGSYKSVSIIGSSKQIEFYRLPFEENRENSFLAIKLHLRLPSPHPSIFNVYADDCIHQIKVNSKKVTNISYPLCGGENHINLKKYLKESLNTFIFILENNKATGRFDIRVSNKDFYQKMFNSSLAVFILVFYVLIARKIKLKKEEFILYLILISGISLRLFYCLSTSYWMRAYDYFPHLDYIKFLLNYHQIPKAGLGGEFHQPPLYYSISALYFLITKFLSIRYYNFISSLQIFSFLLSSASLVVAFLTIKILPKVKDNFLLSTVSLSILSFMPANVFFSSRVTNDSLAEFLGLLAFYFLVKFNKENNKEKNWYIFNLISGFALLAKLTTLSILATGLAVVGLNKDFDAEKRAKLLWISIFIIFTITSFYFLARYKESSTLLPNSEIRLNENLYLKNSLSNFLTFNPASFIKTPFNDSWKDEFRRQNFFEYLYKSAFFGEFKFKFRILASTILIFSLILIPLTAYGIFIAIKNHSPLYNPMLFLTTFLLLSILTWRFLINASPAQDFRIISTLTLPISYFTSLALDKIKKLSKKKTSLTLLILSSLWGIFILLTCLV